MSFEMPKIPGGVPIQQKLPGSEPPKPPLVNQALPTGGALLPKQGGVMQLQSGQGLFNIKPGMAAILAIVSGAVQWAKYDLLSNSLAFIPAIFSGSTATMSPAIGFILALVVDLLQKMMWTGINFRNGLNKMEIMKLVTILLLVCAEVMGVAMPIVVPDISGLNMAELPAIFWSRFFYQLFGAGVFIALGGLGIIIGLTIMPEFLHEEAEKNIGTTASWVLFGVGIMIARAIYSAYTGSPIIPTINWF